ncbi:hypothetical protein [Azospirillum sp. sgz302134]
MRRGWWLAGPLCAVGLAFSTATLAASDNPFAILENSDQASKQVASDANRFAWDVFVALNTPTAPNGVLPWENLRQTSTVYLPNGAKPPAWGQPVPPPPASVTEQAQAIGMDMNQPFNNLDSMVQADGLPLKDKWNKYTRYQILMSQYALDYIIDNTLYNVNGQQAFAAKGVNAAFPAPAFEVKTSWIFIGKDKALRDELAAKYVIANTYYEIIDADGNRTGTYDVGWGAMTGMHVMSKALPEWVWMTFENVNNPAYTQTSLTVPIPDNVQALNKEYQQKLAGSVLANYQLDGTQTTFNGPPLVLANSQIESAFQHASSCISCHATSAYSTQNGYFNYALQAGTGGITYPVGDSILQSLNGYTQFDYAWSLKRASRVPN